MGTSPYGQQSSRARPRREGARRFDGPFGGLEQRELEHLGAIGATAAHIVLVVVLRVRANGAGVVIDSVATIAEKSLLSPATVKRGLEWLVGKGIVERGPRSKLPGGRPGQWGRAYAVRASSSWDGLRLSESHSPSAQVEPKPSGTTAHENGATAHERPSNGSSHEGLSRVVPDLSRDDQQIEADEIRRTLRSWSFTSERVLERMQPRDAEGIRLRERTRHAELVARAAELGIAVPA